LFVGRLSGRCEENRVFLTSINPAFTSQKCSQCGEIHSESRNGEVFLCKNCGIQMDADYNASINIKNSFLNKEPTVPNDTKLIISFPNFD
jgi:transposase